MSEEESIEMQSPDTVSEDLSDLQPGNNDLMQGDTTHYKTVGEYIEAEVTDVERVKTDSGVPDEFRVHVSVPYGGRCSEHDYCTVFANDWPYFWNKDENWVAELAENRNLSKETLHMLEGKNVLVTPDEELNEDNPDNYAWAMSPYPPREMKENTSTDESASKVVMGTTAAANLLFITTLLIPYEAFIVPLFLTGAFLLFIAVIYSMKS